MSDLVRVHPVLRMYDVAASKRFYLDYLGWTLDWQDGDPDHGPVYAQVSFGDLQLHLSTHHDDGTPGTVVVLEVTGLADLHERLHATDYPFMKPGYEEGPGEGMHSVEVIDPAANRIRLFERDAGGG